jgi:hypothetical protein
MSRGAGARRSLFRIRERAPHAVDDSDDCHPDARADRVHGKVADIGMPPRRPCLKRLEQASHGDAHERQHQAAAGISGCKRQAQEGEREKMLQMMLDAGDGPK